MPNNFKLEVITPVRQFLQADVEAATILCLDGEITILANHAPMVAALKIGALKIKENGTWRSAFQSEGFIVVRPDEVLIFAQTCEWPEEIDIARAEEAMNRALEKLRHKQSINEHKHTGISLTRALTRLKIGKNHNH
ncbi:MAG: ATP synthase F1 subunit epsilon [Eubacteriales bacterium]